MKYLLFISLLLFTGSINAQNYILYHNLVNEAEYWLHTGNYKHARKLYQRAFRLESPFAKDSYLLAKCYALMGKKKKCEKWLEKSAKTRLSFAPYFIKNPEDSKAFLNVFITTEELEKVSNNLKVIVTATALSYKDSVFHKIQDTIKALVAQDQMYRKKGDFDTWTESERIAFHKNDSLVQTTLLNLTSQHGYLGYYRYGTDIAGIILVHTLGDEKMYKLQKETLYSELQAGRISPFIYARMIDRWQLHNNTCMYNIRIYTAQICQPKDYEQIIANRLAIGLSIYFKGPRYRKPSYNLQPWVDDTFIKKYSFLKKCRNYDTSAH